MPIAGYDTEIVREPGASVIQVSSAGLVSIQSGGIMTVTTLTPTGGMTFTNTGTLTVQAATAEVVAAGASLTITGGSFDAGAFTISDGTRTVSISSGRNPPTFTASGGSLYLRSDGSMSKLYINRSDGTSTSTWVVSTGSA